MKWRWDSWKLAGQGAPSWPGLSLGYAFLLGISICLGMPGGGEIAARLPAAAGLALAAMKGWPALPIAAVVSFAAHWITQGGAVLAGIGAGGDAIGIYCLWRWICRDRRGCMDKNALENGLRLLAAGIAVMPAAAATLQAFGTCAAMGSGWSQYGPIWLRQWNSGFLAVSMMLPLLLIWPVVLQMKQANRRQAETIDQLVRTQSALLELSHLDTRDARKAWQHICKIVARTLRASRVGIWRFSDTYEEIECLELFNADLNQYHKGQKFQSESMPGYCEALESSLAILAEDAVHDPKMQELAGPYLIPASIVSKMDVPFRIQGLLAGFVACEQTKTSREWTEDEIGFLTTVGSITGLMFEGEHQKIIEREREKLLGELQEAMAKIKTLSGLVPICSGCKKIRDDTGYWNRLETYIQKHSEARFSHGLCPDCAQRLFPGAPLPVRPARGPESVAKSMHDIL